MLVDEKKKEEGEEEEKKKKRRPRGGEYLKREVAASARDRARMRVRVWRVRDPALVSPARRVSFCFPTAATLKRTGHQMRVPQILFHVDVLEQTDGQTH